MSWADDIRCLFCDGRLPLYRKIANGQFCSSAHRKAYWQEQERLAVERLHQTHDSLHALRILSGVETILGPVPDSIKQAEIPEFAQLPVNEQDRPWWITQVNTGEVPMANLMANGLPPRPQWLADELAGPSLEPLSSAHALRRPLKAAYKTYDCGFPPADLVEMRVVEMFAGQVAWTPVLTRASVEPVFIRIDPVRQVPLCLEPETGEMHPVEAAEEEFPRCDGLLTLARLVERENAAAPLLLSPSAISWRAHFPLEGVNLDARLAPGALAAAGLRQLPVDHIARVQGVYIDTLRAVEPRSHPVAALVLETPPLRPRLRLAAGRRYAVETRKAAVAASHGLPSEPAGFKSAPPEIPLPKRQAPLNFQEPNPAGLVPLAYTARPSASSASTKLTPKAAPPGLSNPQPPRTEPMRPVSKLEPLDEKPVSDQFAPPPAPVGEEKRHVWNRAGLWNHGNHADLWNQTRNQAVDFWHRAPRDLKILAFAMPLLFAVALHPGRSKMHVSAPSSASGFEHNVENALSAQLVNVRQTMTDRAAVALDEDFRSGLDAWTSRGDATTEWSFDATGFVRPGPLALYHPSMGLTDYQLQFLGMIDKKALSWVVRAADFNNFYVVKLVVRKTGPLPEIGLTRYAVVNGKADAREDRVVPIQAREDTLYRVRMDVHGDDFALWVQGHMVDAWTEARLRQGGVGFFSARGEESRLRWVQVTHQYDMLGRLCAYLAPYNIPSTSGSLQ